MERTYTIIQGQFITFESLEDFKKGFEICITDEDKSRIMTEMERAYNIPLMYREKFWAKHKEVMEFYKTVAKRRKII